MPIEDTHKQYKVHQGQWTRCRDAISGTDAVKNKGTTYLPKLDGQDADEYAAYKKRALFYGASRRTVAGLLGSVMRRRPEVAFYNKTFLQSATIDGDSFMVLCEYTLREQLSTGRLGLLVDAQAEGSDPYIATYTAESIRNWKTAMIDGRRELVQVVLSETYETPATNDNTGRPDEFTVETNVQYRVLELVRDGPTGALVYQQRLFRQEKAGDGSKGQWVEVRSIPGPDGTAQEYPFRPSKRGAAFTYIPFVIINTTDLSPDVAEPPLLDLVDVNLSHYRTAADLEHGAHYTALPTAWVAGFDNKATLRIGSQTAWVSDNADAKAGFLEFEGQGLDSLRNLMDDKEQMMAVLGSRMLEDQKKAAEAEGTMKLRTAYESGSLVSIANMAGEGLAKALTFVAEWMGETSDNKVKFNTDFVAARMMPNELLSLIQALQAGAITTEIFMWNLEQGEMLPPGLDATTAAQKLDLENPFGPTEQEDGEDDEVQPNVPGGGGGR
jgi:hypothetical protein